MESGKRLIQINCGLFLLFGLGFACFPALLANTITGSVPDSASAVIDLRATYGGLALGLAFVFWQCAKNDHNVALGVKTVLVLMGALASIRLLGIVLDGSPNIFIWLLFVAEVVMASVAWWVLKKS